MTSRVEVRSVADRRSLNVLAFRRQWLIAPDVVDMQIGTQRLESSVDDLSPRFFARSLPSRQFRFTAPQRAFDYEEELLYAKSGADSLRSVFDYFRTGEVRVASHRRLAVASDRAKDQVV